MGHITLDLLLLQIVTGVALGAVYVLVALAMIILILLQRGQFLLALGHTLAHVIGALACAALGFRLTQAVL